MSASATITSPTVEHQHQRPRETAAALLARARSLRAEATRVDPVLADAYLRRAAELSLEAWARAVRHSAVDPEAVVRAAQAAA
jgi:hypothetical protein